MAQKKFIKVFAARGRLLEFIGDEELVSKAAGLAGFDPQEGGSFSLVAPKSSPFGKVIVVGVGKLGDNAENTWLNLGGKTLSKTGSSEKVHIFADVEKDGQDQELLSEFALGLTLRAYDFAEFKTVKQCWRMCKLNTLRCPMCCVNVIISGK